ncbi:SpoIIE family protein phosphatase [Streptomyces sp. NPDC002265]|uniref:SpoIIE family protein phosphatase n=1 Tax=Streptomyces sp. NPDC002265 TaxID=3154415 RepID=UPI0033175E56
MALIIGDVTGHDLAAAVTMGQLRDMLRALVCDRLEPPGDILRRLDVTSHTLYGGQTATCIYARLEPAPQLAAEISQRRPSTAPAGVARR